MKHVCVCVRAFRLDASDLLYLMRGMTQEIRSLQDVEQIATTTTTSLRIDDYAKHYDERIN